MKQSNVIPLRPVDRTGMVFLVPGKPYLNNEALSKGAWGAKKKRRDEVKEAAGTALDILIAQVPEGTFPYEAIEVECRMQYTRKGNFCDTDAPAPMLKATLDTLRVKGVIEDDVGTVVRKISYLPPTGGNPVEGLLVLIHPVDPEEE